jgi:hypothetical protein
MWSSGFVQSERDETISGACAFRDAEARPRDAKSDYRNSAGRQPLAEAPVGRDARIAIEIRAEPGRNGAAMRPQPHRLFVLKSYVVGHHAKMSAMMP